MFHIEQRMPAVIGALGLATCVALTGIVIAGPNAESDADQGVIAVAYDGIPNKVFPVMILEIDGRLQPQPPRDTYFLSAGHHTLRLGALIGDQSAIQRGNIDQKDAKRVLEIDVEGGKRYLIGAKIAGRTAASWEPIIYRVESRSGKPAT